ncbi:MAG: hypothetical protein LAO78_10185 [Acidobacteriia bacterium]|nr:hypothetical protein [Terriglobia bacterium]
MQQPQIKPNRPVAVWAIDVFTGSTLFDLRSISESDAPAISAGKVTDISAQFVADPFMIEVEKTWYMFFEVMNARTGKGDIGLATSKDGHKWDYRQIVLSEPFHLSYPYVFFSEGEFFMVPESYEANAIRLYRAESFPAKWRFEESILEGPWVDSSIFHFDGGWWMFSSPVAPPHQVLELFYSDHFRGPWARHPLSPLINGNNRLARSSGRVIAPEGLPIRFTQDCFPNYGSRVRAFEITQLSHSEYKERELEGSPVLSGGEQSWRETGMHHIDAHFVQGHWLACVDGWRFHYQD